MGKILLYYKYIHIPYPKRVMKWQKKVCQELGLKGRILIAHEGINGTLGGSVENIERYKAIMQKNPLFTDIDFKESTGDEHCFPKLRVVIRDEIVALHLKLEQASLEYNGQHLTPQEAHELMKQKPNDLVILDARNTCESRVGHFTNAITPNIKHFRELPQYIDNHLETFKDKQVLMYCTGGIRCERASAYLKAKNVAKNVYQLKGGIHRYAEQYPDGFFRGKNYVFDGRITVPVNNDVLGTCELCNTSCDKFINCANALCNKHFICCSICVNKFNTTCSEYCKILVNEKKVHKRPPLQNTITQKEKIT